MVEIWQKTNRKPTAPPFRVVKTHKEANTMKVLPPSQVPPLTVEV
jgi:hypothetical protein